MWTAAINAALTALSIHFVAGWISPLSKGGLRSHRQPSLRPLSAAQPTNDGDSTGRYPPRYPGGEVLGSGKIGSYLLHRLNGPILPLPSKENASELQYPQSLNAAAVPRGVASGCLSPKGTPIYACVPSSSIRDVWDATVPERREDLVFLCNCIPSEHLRFDDDDVEVTVAVLHFGVSQSHRGDNSNAVSIPVPKLNASPESPPTVVYGKHADMLASLLRSAGVLVHTATSPSEVQAAAARKLAWSSSLWVMVHGAGDEGRPVTVKDIHETKSDELRRLVEEVLPSLEALASKSWTKNDKDDVGQSSAGTVDDVLAYLEQYSMSISNGDVIPSKDLALREIRDRNGLLLRTAGDDQSYHKELLRRVAGEEVLAKCLEKGSNQEQHSTSAVERVKCTSSNLEFLFQSNQSTSERPTEVKKAIVVGAGMLGSNIAYHLTKRGVKVTVMDRRTNLLPPENEQQREIDPGTATCSSFAWLNSNDKTPLQYKQFNQLGMEVWRRHNVLGSLPVWCGSMVRTAKQEGVETDVGMPTLKHGPFYAHVGPLSSEEARRLEPGIDWESSGASKADTEGGGEREETEIHLYPEEGHVDPYEAVKKLRLSARDNGVDFRGGVEISCIVRDVDDRVIGVECVNSQGGAEPTFVAADIVVIAAGANSSDPSLGIGSKRLKLLEQPGMLAFARGLNDSEKFGEHQRLKGIFVDTIAQAHVLRRPDGTMVVGGGQLVVGGDDDALSASSSAESQTDEDALVGNAMIQSAAKGIAPFELQQYELTRVTRANRPMPSDGLPVVGFVDEGLYVAVMHSAVTMGPLVGELAAYEVVSGEGFQILDRYRPSQSRAEC
ncbi:hypothetical protein ACHAXT_000394 [Thalassiosira profunda]